MTEQHPELWWSPTYGVMNRDHHGHVRDTLGPGIHTDGLPADATRLYRAGEDPIIARMKETLARGSLADRIGKARELLEDEATSIEGDRRDADIRALRSQLDEANRAALGVVRQLDKIREVLEKRDLWTLASEVVDDIEDILDSTPAREGTAP